MADLDAAIRAKLADDDVRAADDIYWDVYRDALLAVLDRHKPRSAGVPGKPHIMDCSTCRDLGPEINSPTGWPCDEIEDIAKALGVEADGG